MVKKCFSIINEILTSILHMVTATDYQITWNIVFFVQVVRHHIVDASDVMVFPVMEMAHHIKVHIVSVHHLLWPSPKIGQDKSGQKVLFL